MAKLFQKGDALDYANPKVSDATTTIKAGTVVVTDATGDSPFVGVVQNDIEPDALGSIAITGVWIVPVASGATFIQGAPVYWDASNAKAVASGGVFMGRAAYEAGEGATEVKVRLEPGGDAGYANA